MLDERPVRAPRQVEAAVDVEPLPVLFKPASAAPIRGQVVEAFTGLSLVGVVVRWICREVPRGRSNGERGADLELGRAVTGADGTFEIVLADDPHAATAVCGLSHGWGHGQPGGRRRRRARLRRRAARGDG